MKSSLPTILGVALVLSAIGIANAQQPSPAERVATLKANLAASQAMLKQYEWVETTVVTFKDEEKSRQMNRCYHGADGKIQKIPVTTPPPAEAKRGLRGRIAAAKKEELSDYMKEAVNLVKEYVPPDQSRIQAAKDSGKMSITPLPGQRVRVTFTDYLKTGDSFSLEVDSSSSRPLEAKVSSYLDTEKEPVSMDIRFSVLDNNTTYAATTTLDAKAKNLRVTVENSGYRRP